ncbi:MAG TPA: ribosome biogenesis GTP-binding protein YihA/YsxC [Novosphingobium sp.]|nr:ribosome biogenesis GTP-binding protein YihA/YsxC [Novosphingobium sp.]
MSDAEKLDQTPVDPALVEEARKLFSGRVEFLLSAPALQFLPDPVVPEIALAGRSNVGKSSLLNAITGRKGLARASVTPGRTQELNFFEVGGAAGELPDFRLVDMPGYGFAKAPPAVVEKWKRLVREFLRGRVVLKRCLLLIDSRHGPKPVDIEMMQMLDEAAVGYRIILTKADKVKASELAGAHAAAQAEARKHSAAFPQVAVTSSETGLGIAELRAAVLGDTLV